MGASKAGLENVVDMLCRIYSSLIFRIKIYDVRCVQSVRQIFRFTLSINSKKYSSLPSKVMIAQLEEH